MKNKVVKKSAESAIMMQLNTHRQTVKAILEDYVASEGEILEVEQSINDLAEMVDDCEMDFDYLLDRLKALGKPNEEESRELLKLIDEEVINERIEEEIENKNDGFALVKITNMDQQRKLEEFVSTEIWPHYNEKDNYQI